MALCKQRSQGPGKQSHTNAHPHQGQGDTVQVHCAQANQKGTNDFNIQVQDFISLPKHGDRALEKAHRLQQEKLWMHKCTCSAPQGLNIVE